MNQNQNSACFCVGPPGNCPCIQRQRGNDFVLSVLTGSIPSNKPCESICSKCGGTDIYRDFLPKGKTVCYRDVDGIDSESIEKYTERVNFNHQIKHDCIKHSCRTCHYEWIGDTL